MDHVLRTSQKSAARHSFSKRQPSRRVYRRHRLELLLELLEDRTLLATDTWTGAAVGNPNWGDGANWLSGSAPQPGDDLVFPSGAVQLTNVDNLKAAPLAFNSITFTGTGYSISGTGVITVGAGGAAYHECSPGRHGRVQQPDPAGVLGDLLGGQSSTVAERQCGGVSRRERPDNRRSWKHHAGGGGIEQLFKRVSDQGVDRYRHRRPHALGRKYLHGWHHDQRGYSGDHPGNRTGYFAGHRDAEPGQRYAVGECCARLCQTHSHWRTASRTAARR